MARRRKVGKTTAVLLLLLLLLGAAGPGVGAQGGANSHYIELQELLSVIKANYAGQIEEDQLWEGALRGVVDALGDPHSTYLDQGELEEFVTDTAGTYAGVGLVITIIEGELTVVTPLQDTPAFRAGLQAGDRIIAIDGRKVQGMPPEEAADLLRGEPGTGVVVQVRRDGAEFALELTREVIEVNPVHGEMLEGQIGYIAISSFNEHTERKLLETLRRLEARGMEGLVLDLRNNPGGFLSQALAVVRQFAPSGPILELEERDGERQVFSSYRDLDRWPLAILVNGGSASAAEIVAGVLQDLDAATLVGESTFGKGTAQAVFPLRGGGAVKLTTARYYTPSGQAIGPEGVEPDLLVPEPPLAQVPPLDRDRQLSRGASGPAVVHLQRALGLLGYPSGPVDGVFGSQTEAALCSFQEEAGLPVTGLADGATLDEINRALDREAGDIQLEQALKLLEEKVGHGGKN